MRLLDESNKFNLLIKLLLKLKQKVKLMGRKRILWLASWYPNRYDKFNGDFIQRHAQAASIENDIYVIHLQDADDITKTEEEVNVQGKLVEQLIYFKKGSGLLGKLIKQIRYFSIYRRAIKEYIKKYGLPHCVHVHVPWKAGLLALWMKSKYRVPYLLTEHWTIYHHSLKDNFNEKSVFFKNCVKHIFKKAEILLVVSKILGQSINQMVLSKRYQVLPNVVNTNLFKYKSSKCSLFTFLHVSNMASFKNVDKIIYSFYEFINKEKVDARLLFIGHRDDKYKKLTEILGILNKEVFFKGEISYHEVCEEMQRAHCLIMSSTYETFSCVVAEALCCGLPVIATRVGVTPEVVTKKNGILINDSDDLQLAMKEIYNNYVAYDAVRISEEAKSRFNVEIISKQFDIVYNQIKSV